MTGLQLSSTPPVAEAVACNCNGWPGDTAVKATGVGVLSSEPLSSAPGLGIAPVRTVGVAPGGVRLPVAVSVPGVSSPGVRTPGVNTPGVSGPGVSEPGVREPDVEAVSVPGVPG